MTAYSKILSIRVTPAEAARVRSEATAAGQTVDGYLYELVIKRRKAGRMER